MRVLCMDGCSRQQKYGNAEVFRGSCAHRPCSDKHHGQPRRHRVLLLHFGDVDGDLGPDFLGNLHALARLSARTRCSMDAEADAPTAVPLMRTASFLGGIAVVVVIVVPSARGE